MHPADRVHTYPAFVKPIAATPAQNAAPKSFGKSFRTTFFHFFLQFTTLRKRALRVKSIDLEFVNHDNDLEGRGKWVYRPDSVGQKPDDHSSGRTFTSSLKPPTRICFTGGPPVGLPEADTHSLFGVAPGGV